MFDDFVVVELLDGIGLRPVGLLAKEESKINSSNKTTDTCDGREWTDWIAAKWTLENGQQTNGQCRKCSAEKLTDKMDSRKCTANKDTERGR